MLMKLFKRWFYSQKSALADANARIAELEKELTETKSLLKIQTQTINKEAKRFPNPDIILDRTDAQSNPQHLFFKKHCIDDQLANYLIDRFPILTKPIPWHDEEVFINTTDEKFYINIKQRGTSTWAWNETEDCVKIVNYLESYGFFDTSESEDYFSYSIRYLGESLDSNDQYRVDNEKIDAPLPTLYSRKGTQSFIAQNPFGMTGFFEITWLVK